MSTPFVDESGTVPTVTPSWRTGRCFGSSEPGRGRCEDMGLTFETIDEWEEHRAEYHPTNCSKNRCDNVSSYIRMGSPHSHCVEHMPDDDTPRYAWLRTNQEALVDVPTLPADHPIESALRGLGV